MLRPQSPARRGGLLGFTLILAVAAAGCGGKKMYPVSGRVVFKDDGSPLAGGLVVFEPQDASIKESAKGDIRPDGTFELGTRSGSDGVLEGKYRVLITPPLPPKRKEKSVGPPMIHPRYQKLETTDLEVTVGPKTGPLRLEIDRPGGPPRK